MKALLLIMFLLALALSSAQECADCIRPENETALRFNNVTSVCGNGVSETGETHENCCLDTGCPSGKVCQQGSCVQEDYSWAILAVITLLALIGTAFIVGKLVVGHHKDVKSLSDYIEKARRANLSDSKILDALKSNGWNEDEIEEALSALAR